MYVVRNSKICIVYYENCIEVDECVTSIMKKIGRGNRFIATSDQGNANKMDSIVLALKFAYSNFRQENKFCSSGP